jgi:competence protein ComEA
VSFILDEETEEAEAVNEALEHTVTDILIDIKGAVIEPGVYKMKSGDRIMDAVLRAGGFLENADTRKVNLAALLADEMVIIVPLDGEEDVVVVQHSITEGASAFSDNGGKININTATEEELTRLSGVGPAKAKAIINYRSEQGMFKKNEDIKNVTGIGEKSFEKFKNEITVSN